MSTSDLTDQLPPALGVIFLRSPSLFGDADAPQCRRFLDRVFRAEEILGVTISGGDSRAELSLRPGAQRPSNRSSTASPLLESRGAGRRQERPCGT